MNKKFRAALLGGSILGLFLVVTVVISSVAVRPGGCCNCLWPILAGLLAVMFYVKSSDVPATTGDGASVGALAGVVGGLIYLVIGLPLSYFLAGGTEAIDVQIRQISPDFPLTGMALFLIGGLVGVVMCVVLSTVGGLIGVPLFEKRKGVLPPPPPAPSGGAGGYPG